MAFTEGLCDAIVANLDEFQASAELKRDPTGYIEALASSENRAGFEQIPVPSDGTDRDVKLKYLQRGISTDMTSDAHDCAATGEIVLQQSTVTVDRFIRSIGHTFSDDDMRKLCDGANPKLFQLRAVNSLLNAATVELDKAALALQAANFGNFLSGVNTAKSVDFLTADNKAEYFGESTLMEDLEDIGAKGRPLVVGSGNIGHYARMTDIGCCNDGGQDMGQAGAFGFYRDRFAGAILGGANHFAALEQGAVQLLTWNKNKGNYRKTDNMFIHDTLLDPRTGIEWDFYAMYDPCPGVTSWKVWLSLYYEVFFSPSDAFNAADDLFGTNGTLHYNATKAVVV